MSKIQRHDWPLGTTINVAILPELFAYEKREREREREKEKRLSPQQEMIFASRT